MQEAAVYPPGETGPGHPAKRAALQLQAGVLPHLEPVVPGAGRGQGPAHPDVRRPREDYHSELATGKGCLAVEIVYSASAKLCRNLLSSRKINEIRILLI